MYKEYSKDVVSYLQAFLNNNAKDKMGFVDDRLVSRDAKIFLNANEAAQVPPWFSDFNIYDQDNIESLANRYSNPNDQELGEAYRDYLGGDLDPRSLLLTRGSDEAIDVIFRAVCNPGDKVLYCPPTYDHYQLVIDTHGFKEVTVNLTEDYQLDLATIKNTIINDPKIKILVICNPNNPTGGLLNPQDIKELLDFSKDRLICLIDEAYMDFNPQASFIPLINSYPHLVITRTLSKAFGLAGLRLGFAISHPLLRNAFRYMQLPYPIASNLLYIVKRALDSQGLSYLQDSIDEIIELRTQTIEQLKQLHFVTQVYSGNCNFIFLKVSDADQVFNYLKIKGILIKNLNSIIPNGLRISIGSRSEMEQLIKILIDY